MTTITTLAVSDRGPRFRPENAAWTSRRQRELADEPPAGVPAWTPDDGDPS